MCHASSSDSGKANQRTLTTERCVCRHSGRRALPVRLSFSDTGTISTKVECEVARGIGDFGLGTSERGRGGCRRGAAALLKGAVGVGVGLARK